MTFFLFTKLGTEVATKMDRREELGRKWLEQVKEKCPEVKFIAHYALFGKYDFVDIYEAPNEETAAKVAMISRKNGALDAESLVAMPYNRLVELAEEI